MVDIFAAISSVSSAIEIAKAIGEAKNSFDQAELKSQTAELYSKLADAKLALMQAQEELNQKDKEIERLKSTFSNAQEMVVREGFRFIKGADGEPKGKPHCPRCYEVDGRLMMMFYTKDGGFMSVACPQCKTHYHSPPNYLEEGE